MGRLKESGRILEKVLRRNPLDEKAQVLLKKMIEWGAACFGILGCFRIAFGIENRQDYL